MSKHFVNCGQFEAREEGKKKCKNYHALVISFKARRSPIRGSAREQTRGGARKELKINVCISSRANCHVLNKREAVARAVGLLNISHGHARCHGDHVIVKAAEVSHA